jgi:hypothetical protein
MIGATVIDTALDGRRGLIVNVVDAERLDVYVSWKPGQITTLDPDDIRAGRYQIIVLP